VVPGHAPRHAPAFARIDTSGRPAVPLAPRAQRSRPVQSGRQRPCRAPRRLVTVRFTVLRCRGSQHVVIAMLGTNDAREELWAVGAEHGSWREPARAHFAYVR
jgi:hypothetical protein